MLRVKAMLCLVRVVVLSGLVMWVAMELRGDYWTVRLVLLEATLASIVKMLGSPATQVGYYCQIESPMIIVIKDALEIRHRTKVTLTIIVPVCMYISYVKCPYI